MRFFHETLRPLLGLDNWCYMGFVALPNVTSKDSLRQADIDVDEDILKVIYLVASLYREDYIAIFNCFPRMF